MDGWVEEGREGGRDGRTEGGGREGGGREGGREGGGREGGERREGGRREGEGGRRAGVFMRIMFKQGLFYLN
jgi:hypothetical protein